MNIEKADGTYQIIPISNEAQRVTVKDGLWNVQDDQQIVEQKVAIFNEDEGERIGSCLSGSALLGTEDTWKFIFVRRGSYYIQNQEGKVLTLDPNNGNISIEVLNEADDTYQRWYVEETEVGEYERLYRTLEKEDVFYIKNGTDIDMSYLSARNDSVQEGTMLQVTKDWDGESLQFSFKKIEDGKYEIVNNHSGKLVTAVPEVDNSARLMDENGSEGQIWSFENAMGTDGYEYYYLKSENGYYLGADLELGTTTLSERQEKTKQFKWVLSWPS